VDEMRPETRVRELSYEKQRQQHKQRHADAETSCSGTGASGALRLCVMRE